MQLVDAEKVLELIAICISVSLSLSLYLSVSLSYSFTNYLSFFRDTAVDKGRQSARVYLYIEIYQRFYLTLLLIISLPLETLPLIKADKVLELISLYLSVSLSLSFTNYLCSEILPLVEADKVLEFGELGNYSLSGNKVIKVIGVFLFFCL